jgi:hypothetical protein
MKKFAVLLTLSALLAACSSNQTPQVAPNKMLLSASATGMGISAKAPTAAAALNTNPQVSSRLADPAFSLGLLQTTPTQVTASVKTPYPLATLCTLDWGDSTTTTVATPTTTATYNHTYAANSTQSVTFSCIARRLTLATQTVGITLGNFIDFETPLLGNNGFASYDNAHPFIQNGYSLSPQQYIMYLVDKNTYAFFSLGGVTSSQTIFSQYDSPGRDTLIFLRRVGGGAFSLKSFKMGSLDQTASSFLIEAYNGTTLVASLTTPVATTTDPTVTVVLPSSWSNLTDVRFHNSGTNNIVLDDILAIP